MGRKATANYKVVEKPEGRCYQFFCDLSGAHVCTTKVIRGESAEQELETAWMREGKSFFNQCQKCGRFVSDMMFNADELECVECAPWENISNDYPKSMADRVRLEGMKRFGFGPDVMKGKKVCRICGQSCSSGEKYCSRCNAILPKETVFDLYKTYHLYCPVCDTVVSRAARYCPECGERLRQKGLESAVGERFREKLFRSLHRMLFLLIISALCIPAACGKQGDYTHETPRAETVPAASETEIQEQESETLPEPAPETEKIKLKNTYWRAVAYQQKDEESWLNLPAAASGDRTSWWLDLFLYADGSMRLRDVSGNFYHGLSMAGKWEESGEGLPVITEGNSLNDGYLPSEERLPEEELPVFMALDTALFEEKQEISAEAPLLVMEYYDGIVYFEQDSMPEEDRMLCIADMRGSWTFVSGMTDGSGYSAEKGIIKNIVFEEGNYQTESVHTGYDKYIGEMTEFRASVFYREKPLYEGCGNESWSVELRPQDPEWQQDEYYATLLDEDTLLLQGFYTVDGIRFVSYETYTRSTEARDALFLQDKLETVLAQCPANTLFCIGTDMFTRSSYGVEALMETVQLTEENPDTMMLLCPEYIELLVYWNGEVIHETELGYRNSELMLLKIPEKNGVCQFTFTSDSENWYTLDISRETFPTPQWTNVLDPAGMQDLTQEPETAESMFYDTGKLRALVPEGWAAFPVPDVFADEPGKMKTSCFYIIKGGTSDSDVHSKPYVMLEYYGSDIPVTEPDEVLFANVEEVSSMQIGERIWNGYVGEDLSGGYGNAVIGRMASLWTVENGVYLTATIRLEFDGQKDKISLEDKELQAILASVELSDDSK